MRDFLLKELHTLRKGPGITPWKLSSATELRTAIAKRTGIAAEHLTPEQMHTFLRYELDQLGENNEAWAIRNALALGQEEKPGKLIERRARLARQLDRHMDTIEAYENRGIKLLLSRLNGIGRSSQPLNEPAADVAARSTQAAVPEANRMADIVRDMITAGISELYGIDAHASEILHSFGRNPLPYMDASIEWILLPSARGEAWYVSRYHYTFRRHKSCFRVGIVTTNDECEALMASGVVDDALKLNAGVDYEREVASIQRSSFFVVNDVQTGIKRSLSFLELRSDTQRALLALTWQVDPETCRIIEVQIPPDMQKPTTIYEYVAICDFQVDDRSSFWYSPGLMYLNSIVLDVSRFPGRERWRFSILPFFGQVFPGTLEPTGDRYTMPAGNWIMQGHGFALTWQEK